VHSHARLAHTLPVLWSHLCCDHATEPHFWNEGNLVLLKNMVTPANRKASKNYSTSYS